MSTAAWKPMNKALECAAVLPINPNLSYSKSAAFVKRLTLHTLSTIVYHRRMFSPQCFQETHFFGCKIMMLKEKSGAPLADFVSSSLASVFEAFDKRYLHEIVFSVYEDSRRPESRIESYSFQFQYHGASAYVSLDGNTPKASNMSELQQVQKATQNMLEIALELASGERPLPAQFELEFRVYYNESTPAEYCPRKFKDQPYQDDELLASLVQHASVHTHFHTVITKKYSAAMMIAQQPSHEANTIDNEMRSQSQGPLVDWTEPVRQDREPGRQYYDVRCVCGSDVQGDDVINSRCILCVYCDRLQHAACFGWYGEEDLQNHCCVLCARGHRERVCTDEGLLGLDSKTARALCVLRRTLEWCTHASSVTARLLSTSFQFNDTGLSVNKLISKLEKDGILEPLPPTTSDLMEAERPVNNAAAKEAIQRRLSRMRLQTSSQDSGSELDSRRRQNHTAEAPLQVHQNETLGQPLTNGDERMSQEDKTPFVMPERGPETMATEPVNPKKDWVKKAAATEFQSIGEEGGVQDMELEELPLSGSHNPVQPQQLNITKKRKTALRRKRKADEEDANYRPYANTKRNKK